MAYFLPALENLEGQLNRYGDTQRQQGQQSIQNAMQLNAQNRANAQFDFQKHQANESQAIAAFGNALKMGANDPNGQLGQLMSTLSGGDTKGAISLATGITPTLMTQARQIYQNLQKQGLTDNLPPEYRGLFGSTSLDPNAISDAINQQEIQDYKQKETQGTSQFSRDLGDFGNAVRHPLDWAGNALGQVGIGSPDQGSTFGQYFQNQTPQNPDQNGINPLAVQRGQQALQELIKQRQNMILPGASTNFSWDNPQLAPMPQLGITPFGTLPPQ
jgi:hypothetical protein